MRVGSFFYFSILLAFFKAFFLSHQVEGSLTRLELWKAIQNNRLTFFPLHKEKFAYQSIFRVYVDVGHGGKNEGAVGLYETQEKILVLKIAQLLKKFVPKYHQNKKIILQLSRETDKDLSLQDRAMRANLWEADLFVSLHLNATLSQEQNGFEVYLLKNKVRQWSDQDELQPRVEEILEGYKENLLVQKSYALAEHFYSWLAKSIVPNKLGIQQAPFVVLSHVNMPAVLLELGYLTHPKEAKMLRQPSYQRKLAKVVSDAILEYISLFSLKEG